MPNKGNKMIVYALPNGPIILKGTKEEIANLLDCKPDDFRPALVVSAKELREMKKSDPDLLAKRQEMVRIFRENNIVRDDTREEADFFTWQDFIGQDKGNIQNNEFVKKLGSKK